MKEEAIPDCMTCRTVSLVKQLTGAMWEISSANDDVSRAAAPSVALSRLLDVDSCLVVQRLEQFKPSANSYGATLIFWVNRLALLARMDIW